jgi:pimeloyl-ACP methyl ester carboxylesterase
MEALIAYWLKQREMQSLEDALPTMTMPCLLLAGQADPRYLQIHECAAHMPNATFGAFPDLNHVGTLYQRLCRTIRAAVFGHG